MTIPIGESASDRQAVEQTVSSSSAEDRGNVAARDGDEHSNENDVRLPPRVENSWVESNGNESESLNAASNLGRNSNETNASSTQNLNNPPVIATAQSLSPTAGAEQSKKFYLQLL